jgi:translation initiation factor 2D
VVVSLPLAVGRMALPSDQLKVDGKEKGKAVHIIHTWKDHLWDMGSKGDIPEATSIHSSTDETASHSVDQTDVLEDALSSPVDTLSNLTILDPPTSEPLPTLPSYTSQEVTTLLHMSMLQAISDAIPASSFPIPATAFYTNYILPSRPAFPSSILPPSETSPDSARPFGATEITIKTSSHKSLTTFLKAAEKAYILTLKAPQKHSQQPELLITSVNETHPSVSGHHLYETVRDIEEKAARRALREKEREQQGESLAVRELWKPHQASLNLFEEMGGE